HGRNARTTQRTTAIPATLRGHEPLPQNAEVLFHGYSRRPCRGAVAEQTGQPCSPGKRSAPGDPVPASSLPFPGAACGLIRATFPNTARDAAWRDGALLLARHAQDLVGRGDARDALAPAVLEDAGRVRARMAFEFGLGGVFVDQAAQGVVDRDQFVDPGAALVAGCAIAGIGARAMQRGLEIDGLAECGKF